LKIGILGAGFVGLTLAARLLEPPKTDIILIEIDAKKREQMLSGISYVEEPGLSEIIQNGIYSERLKITGEVNSEELDALFITIGTPRPSLKSDSYFLETIEVNLSQLKIGGLLLLRSTVSIGVTNRVQNLVQAHGRFDLTVVFAPERTAEGVALQELRELPQILGADSEVELTKARAFLESLGFDVVVAKGSRESEMAKLACNTWRDVTFAFSNELVEIGAYLNVDTLDAIQIANSSYPRAKIPLPGPVGGPCLSKDSYILTSSYAEKVQERSLILHARLLNESLATQVSSFITKTLTEKPNLHLLICGLAFKGQPKTNDIRDSFAVQLLSNISTQIESGRVKIWDPHVSQVERENFKFEFIESMPIENPLMCVLTNNAPFLRSDFPGSTYSMLRKDSIIVDLWGNISLDAKLEAKLISLGRKSWSEVVHAK
jgi:UDP-N-acetyl-D-mannosaminuronic acid dehydrogenase